MGSRDEPRSDECIISAESSSDSTFLHCGGSEDIPTDIPTRVEFPGNGRTKSTSVPQTELHSGYPETDSGPLSHEGHVPYKRPFIVSDEPVRNPSSSSRLVGAGWRDTNSHGERRQRHQHHLRANNTRRRSRRGRGARKGENRDACNVDVCAAITDDDMGNVGAETGINRNAPRRNSTSRMSRPDPIAHLHVDAAEPDEEHAKERKLCKGKGKRKTVVWDDSVAGGETDTETDETDPYACCNVSEESHDDSCCDDSCEDLGLENEHEHEQLGLQIDAEHYNDADTDTDCEIGIRRKECSERATLPHSNYHASFSASAQKPASFSLNPASTPAPAPALDPRYAQRHVGAEGLMRRSAGSRGTTWTPSAQDNEELDIYRRATRTRGRNRDRRGICDMPSSSIAHREKEPAAEEEGEVSRKARFAAAHPCSLAMPGRRRGREIGMTTWDFRDGDRDRGMDGDGDGDGIHVGVRARPTSKRVCPTCGNMAMGSLIG
ncbi:hypothetical protein F5Y08DRAFT_260481 [Xylaria arbuscula]|nr:hypothetical protein F5Y08DRAFT_260481 [Xylaria arbuscula]